VQRLSTLDASFLRVETPSAHMHVGWLATLKLPAGVAQLDAGKLAERVAARLHLAPRFRQRVVPAPLGEPMWVDNPSFSVGEHISVESRPARGRRELERLAGAFLSQQLDRERPLWQICVVPRTGPGRAAVFGKVHHAMVDGVAAVELGTLLFDLAPDAALPEVQDWYPERLDAPLRIAVDAVADGALEQFRAARRVAALGLRPRSTLRVAETMRRAALSLAEDVIRPAPSSFVNKPIGARRALVTERVPMSRLERIKRARGVKLNDVVLAAVAGALRRFAATMEGEPIPLRAMVPVSVRSADEADAGGNRITFAFVELPLDEPDAARRLDLVQQRTQELKSSGRIAGSDALLRSMVQLPGFVKERAARLAASPRMYNLAVSNVPGPRMPLYAAGAVVDEIHPVIPISDGHAIAIGVLTYRNALHFSAYVDPEALPEAPELASLFRSALRELEHRVISGRHRGARGARSGAQLVGESSVGR
jgi:diacylglycerol O-acyltransferase / wax synthase